VSSITCSCPIGSDIVTNLDGKLICEGELLLHDTLHDTICYSFVTLLSFHIQRISFNNNTLYVYA
jgi:hypothetical protein